MHQPEKNKLITLVSIVAIVAGCFILAGWLLPVEALKQFLRDIGAIKFNTAIGVILSGVSLLLTQTSFEKPVRAVYTLFSIIVFLLGTISFAEDIFHFQSPLDELFVRDDLQASVHPGRMAINSGFCFMLMGAAALLFLSGRRWILSIGQALLNLTTLMAMIAIAGAIYGISVFNFSFFVRSMPVYTGITFLILSIGWSFIHPTIGIAGIFAGKQVGNRMARMLFPPLAIAFFLLGTIDLSMQQNSLFSSPVGFVLLIVALLIVSFSVVWITARWLNLVDAQRSAAEAGLLEMNDDLEKRVEERSAELMTLVGQVRESEEKYRSLIEHASDSIYVLDLNDNFIEVNGSLCRMLGYRRDELLRMNLHDVLDTEQLKSEPLYKGYYAPGQAIVRERCFVHKNGTRIDVEVNVKKFAEDRVLVIARDVTSRKAMENELREAETKFRTIAERSMVGIYIVKNNKFIYVNPRFAAVFGYTPEEMTGTFDIETVFYGDYKDVVAENVRARLKGEVESVHYEARGQRKDGSPNWVEYYGSRAVFNGELCIMGSMIDITERKEAEQVMKRSEANLQAILDTTDTAYALFDRNLTVFAFNHMAETLMKSLYQHEPQKGDRMADYFPAERFPRFLDQTAEVLKGKNINYEISYPQSDGSERWFHVRQFPIKNDKDEIFGLMLALYDITARKAAEYNLKVAYDRIQWQVNHIREMNWKQSHLVRSPLANLKGLVDLLKHDPSDDDALGHLLSELDRLDQIIIEMAEDASINRPD